ncbi:uncharacterized protein MONOS_4765 [Monocercomonoides exilis]|uniref:uncharacterized protein n=1 Tax=Monocercomonoides exilis TaxID=2049356 RepID=UPI003559E35B|nr:hypothetical protein MONOS_4765 [Monocercomonoides exilis]|eukprot:MONOS_4765.1-p1 / transcript=MONOS_4765.1 / gene=MONOS_4765 / organism=Monocercomonoides_exilis_PA203 / gene_product=unspecified product / transcript_product=unspecified product / location=Mono_scaffold00131:31580-32691(+) / protein_length=304 / sequence_SO=supercontig / SO=protein_coding / is_pseudo=false
MESTSLPEIALHPLIPIQILNSYARSKDESSPYTIGLLLGFKKATCFEVTMSYPLPSFDGKSEEAQVKFFQSTIETHRTVNQHEDYIGWYICGSIPTPSQLFTLHNFFSTLSKNDLIMLSIIPNQTTKKFDFMARLMQSDVVQAVQGDYLKSFQSGTNQAVIQEIMSRIKVLPIYTVASSLEEQIGVNAMMEIAEKREKKEGKEKGEKKGKGKETQDDPLTAIRRLKEMIDIAVKYTDEVVKGEREGDKAIGMNLMEMLKHCAVMDEASFRPMLREESQNISASTQLLQAVVQLADLSVQLITK